MLIINKMEKEFNLSEKIGNFPADKVGNNLIWVKDIKEFIKLLKEYIRLTCVTQPFNLLAEIDKLAGDKLI